MNRRPLIPRMSNLLANAHPSRTSRRAYLKPIVVILSVLTGLAGSFALYQSAEVDLETYKALMFQAGPWCGGGPMLRAALVGNNKITRAKAQELRLALDALKQRGQTCIDPAPEPVLKERRKK
jgi:hypothetical protein